MFHLMLISLLICSSTSSMYEFNLRDVLACAIHQGITADLLEGISYEKPEELYDQLPEARCFLACVLRKMGQFVGDEDTPIIQDLQEKFPAIQSLDFEVTVADCKIKPGEVDDGTCKREYKAFMCFAEKLQELAKTIEVENLGESGLDDAPVGWQQSGMEFEDEMAGEGGEDEQETKTGGEKQGEVDDAMKSEKKVDDIKITDDDTDAKKDDKMQKIEL